MQYLLTLQVSTYWLCRGDYVLQRRGDAHSEGYTPLIFKCRSGVGRPIHTESRCRPTHLWLCNMLHWHICSFQLKLSEIDTLYNPLARKLRKWRFISQQAHINHCMLLYGMDQCCTSVVDGGPALNLYWVIVSWSLCGVSVYRPTSRYYQLGCLDIPIPRWINIIEMKKYHWN